MYALKGYLTLPYEDLAYIKLQPKRIAELDNLAHGLCEATRRMAVTPRTKIAYTAIYPKADFYISPPTDKKLLDGKVIFEVYSYGKLKYVKEI